MDDLISRQAAIDALCDNCDHAQAVCPHYPCKQYLKIEKLPSAQRWIPVDCVCEKINEAHNEGYDVGYWDGRRDYEQKWIPCSERLPRENGDYLVTFKYLIFYPVEVCGFKDGKWDSGMYDVVAWQFIPDPYREDGEQDV